MALLSLGLVIAILAAIVAPSPPRTVRISATMPVRLLGTTLGLGGSFDGFGLTIPLIFNGTAVPEGDTFTVIPYPAVINLHYPIISELGGLSDIPYWPQSLKRSEGVGAGYLEQAIAALPAGEKTTIIGLSQGAQVAEIARAHMAADPAYQARADDYRFVMVGNPYQPNGGILARFTPWSAMPIMRDLIPFGRPGPSDSPFETTYYQNQYDGFADFPAYFNWIAIANAVVGMVFEHTVPGYILASPDSPNAVSTTIGNTTYVTIPKRAPLLAPFRIAASLIGVERFVDAFDPILRVFIEMGYERTADPSQVNEFRWPTPAEKIRDSMATLPAALEQAWEILRGAPFNPTLPQPEVSDSEVPTPVTEHPARPVSNSPVALAVRRAVEALTTLLTAVTLPVAKLLRWASGNALAEPDLPESARPSAPEERQSDELSAELDSPTVAEHVQTSKDTRSRTNSPELDLNGTEDTEDEVPSTEDPQDAIDDEGTDADTAPLNDDDESSSEAEDSKDAEGADDSEPSEHQLAS